MKKTITSTPKKTSESTINLLVALFIAIILLFVLFAASGCKKPTENIKLVVNESDLAKAPVLLHFANANNASTNQPGEFDVKISGRDAALVQIDGGATSGFKASHGFLPLSLTTNASCSASAPVTFNVSAQIFGFAPVNRTIAITKDTATVADIGAVGYANPPQGTGVLVHQSALNTNGQYY